MEEEVLKSPGKRLRAARLGADHTQAQLAAKLGITQSLLSRIWLDKNAIYSVVVPAAQILEVSTDYLLMQSDERKGEARPDSLEADESQEDVIMRILRTAIREVPDAERPHLLRFLMRQVAIYRDIFSGKQLPEEEARQESDW
jgi:transcriptional regulator with XRE-family HTH domain